MRKLLLPLLFLVAGCTSLPPAAEAPALTVRSVPIDPRGTERSVVGRLRYMGGLEITSTDKTIGGFSTLKWRNGLLYTLTDVGDWLSLRPLEEKGRLVGLRMQSRGDLRGIAGEKLEGTATGDSESMTPHGRGWLVSFEHEHKVPYYPRLGEAARDAGLDPERLFGALEENQGIETIASRSGQLFICAERLAAPAAPQCLLHNRQGWQTISLPVSPGLDAKTAFPVDADWGADGTLYIVMRSWSGGNDNRGALIARSPLGEFRLLATFLKPLTVDNYEGVAVREQGGRTFFYIVSDDNFRVYDDPKKPETWQRSLLLKLELLG